ncbi:PARPT polymerase, partial [Amia calva]|nr:PARPT polymerase [Amia calva]
VRYHTHQKDGILVCADFFSGHCHLGVLCPRHHTRRPYHWQIRHSKSKQWMSISDSAQEQLEALYCNPDHDQVKVKERSDATDTYQVDFQSMTTTKGWTYDRVRRLATTTDPDLGFSFHTEWFIFWKEGTSWQKYDEPIASQLEGAFEKGMWNEAFILNGNIYNVYLKNFTQCNVATGYSRSIRRRPCFLSDLRLTENLQRVNHVEQGTSSAFSENPLSRIFSNYPLTWVPDLPNTECFAKIPVPATSEAYLHVHRLLHQTLPETDVYIIAIDQIQNEWLWSKYKAQREFMSWRSGAEGDSAVNEMHLFHGTTANVVEEICKMNFDPRLWGTKHGHVYGQGTYFAKDASCSARYIPQGAGEEHMFLSKVLVGKSTLGNRALRRPPPLPSGDLYDSCVDNEAQPKIFVIFDNSQCYPYFLIRYKRRTGSISVF